MERFVMFSAGETMEQINIRQLLTMEMGYGILVTVLQSKINDKILN